MCTLTAAQHNCYLNWLEIHRPALSISIRFPRLVKYLHTYIDTCRERGKEDDVDGNESALRNSIPDSCLRVFAPYKTIVACGASSSIHYSYKSLHIAMTPISTHIRIGQFRSYRERAVGPAGNELSLSLPLGSSSAVVGHFE